MISKEKLYKQIDKMPDNLEIEDLIERLLLIDKIEKRLTESFNNNTISEKQLDNEIKEWSN